MKTLTKVVLFLGIICLGSIILSGAASATSYSISVNGKNISVMHNYANSTLKDQVSVTKRTGSYGYGYYGTVHTSGKDIKGNNINRTMVYFNKYHNYFTFNDFKAGTLKESNADSSWTTSNIKVISNYLMTATSTGRTFNGLTFSGTENYTLYYASNGQKLIKNEVATTKFYKNSVYYATVTSRGIPTYKYIGNSYLIINETVTFNTRYANNDTRKSIISQLYTRNSVGTLIGMKTSGTSSGTEKVNGKIVTYTGKITIATKYDPRDTWDEKYVTGNYYETRTSTSTNLVRMLPLEAL